MLVNILQLVQDFLDELDDNTSLPYINIEVVELNLGNIVFDEHKIAHTPFGDAVWHKGRNTISVVMGSSCLANIVYTSLCSDPSTS